MLLTDDDDDADDDCSYDCRHHCVVSIACHIGVVMLLFVVGFVGKSSLYWIVFPTIDVVTCIFVVVTASQQYCYYYCYC